MTGEKVEGSSPMKPQSRLELSVNPADGSLLTAPLSLVINTATDALYNDLHNMATGQPITLYLPSADDSQFPFTEKSEAMSRLSFQQRRHVIASRIARHIQSLSHVSALVASNLPSSGAASKGASNESYPNIYAMAQVPAENELSQIAQIASQALEHVRTSWVSADTAQDALYFHHDSLWKMRSHPHDVLGSMEVLLKGQWRGLSKDIKLEDKYLDSVERSLSKVEIKERLKAAVRRKLVLGEVGMLREERDQRDFRWKIILEKNGTAVRLVHGKPRIERGVEMYPIEARVTILSEADPAPWTLLSVRTRTAVKTGESNHQLDLSKEQMFGLHKICERAMNQEEVRVAKLKKAEGIEVNEGDLIARPLQRLLYVAHTFSVSWQMEILSCQAEALRKGSWSSGKSAALTKEDDEDGIAVTPVIFLSQDEKSLSGCNYKMDVLGHMAIHFWQVDDRNGNPNVGPIFYEDLTNTKSEEIPSFSSYNNSINRRLTLEIIAVSGHGLQVSLSGGSERQDDSPNLKKNIHKLLASLQDPYQLSASDALLSAVIICAERRCRAVINALELTRKPVHELDETKHKRSLPPWVHLWLESGSISVGVDISYDNEACHEVHDSRAPVQLFRLECDSRSGKFVATFPATATLLRRLACNDLSASDVQLLRQAKGAPITSLSATEQRRTLARTKDSTGRSIREAFLGLTRSLDILGRRVGVGGEWQDKDPSCSSALRQKAIFESCVDVCTAMEFCAGISAVFGIGALALGIAAGSNPIPDISGGPINHDGTNPFISIPPLSIIMNQRLAEQNVTHMKGEQLSTMKLERELCGIIASTSKDALTLHLLDITCQVDAIVDEPVRIQINRMRFVSNREVKRVKFENDPNTNGDSKSILDEVTHLVHKVIATWEDYYEW